MLNVLLQFEEEKMSRSEVVFNGSLRKLAEQPAPCRRLFISTRSGVLFSCLVLLRHVELALFLESRAGEALRE